MTHPEKPSIFYKIIQSRLAKKQLLYILLFSSIITLIGTCLQLFVEYKDDIENLERQLSLIESSHLESLTSSLWTIDNNQIGIQLNNILSLRDIVYLEIVEKGKAIISAGKQPPKAAKVKIYPLIYNHEDKGFKIGNLHAWASLQGVYQRMLKRLTIILATQGLKTFIVSLFILLILYQNVIRHLVRLSKYTQNITLDNLDLSFSLNRNKTNPPDEMDSLVDMFNNMRQRLYDDIDIIKKADKTLHESEEKFRTMFESSRDAILLLDPQKGFLGCNPAALKMFAVNSKEEFCELNPAVLSPEYQPDGSLSSDFAMKEITKAFEKGGNSFEWIHKSLDGQEFYSTVLLTPMELGERTILQCSIRDITERKQAEAKLRISEERIRTWFETSPVCTKILDLNFNLKYMSHAGIEALKIDNIEGYYGKPYPLDFFPKEFKHSMLPKLEKAKKAKKGDKPITHEDWIVDVKGEETWCFHATIVSVFDDEDNIDYLIVVSNDVTERKRAEERGEKLQAQFTQAQKMEAVGRLAGGVAHDFNNMLSVILGHAEMILEEMTPDQPFYTDLEEIKSAAQRSANLTRQLLGFARKQTVSPKVLDINKTIGSMTRMLQRLIGEDIDLSWLPGEHLWPVRIDPTQVDQILANLCVNSRDAIADVGKITIETNSVSLDEAYCADHTGFVPGEYVMLAVSDNGCGMETETLANIFEPFFTTKEMDQGSGLGLATVYGVVKQNNGFINVYSEPGQGTTFKVYLPRHTAKVAETEERKFQAAGRGHETILLVEDEISILRMTTQMLERLGYQVVSAKTPDEAIRLAHERSDKIDLLMTDVVMPEMNGRDLAENILSHYPKLKRLFMSGYTANVIAHHGVLDEGVNFIQKPFSKYDLSVKLREILDDTNS